jgi:NAD(P)-dependent dehydrogenase (short-subunit alcohol dehydrogenase family)
MRGLAGKVVVVAGGAGGIGTATCVRLAAEGAKVVVGDIDLSAATEVAERITSDAGEAAAVQVDVSDEDSVAALVTAARTRFGGIDAMHCNAADLSPGVIGRDSDVVSIPMEVFDRTMSVNLRGAFLCTRHVVPALVDRGGGALVYTVSVAAFSGEPVRPAYAIAKAGLGALVRHVASKWGRDRIRANAVAPGLVDTGALDASGGQALKERVIRHTRSWRLGDPSDIGAMVSYLISDDAEWINGQVMSVDGGTVLR